MSGGGYALARVRVETEQRDCIVPARPQQAPAARMAHGGEWMHAHIKAGFGFALLLWTSAVFGQEITWRPSATTVRASAPDAAAGTIRLGRPQPLSGDPTGSVSQVSGSTPSVTRAQFPEGNPPPPPPFPGNGLPPAPGGPAPFATPFQDQSPYNCGVVNNNADTGGFWSRFSDRMRRCWGDVTDSVGGIAQPGAGRSSFQSDHCFEYFASPVTNPFYFEDPRALTELRPVFVWQKTPNENQVFAGGNNFFYGLQGRVAFTERLSLVVNKFGFNTLDPRNPIDAFDSSTGFSEIHLGPKFTFWRDQTTGTVMAAGLTFEVPVGSTKTFNDTGTLGLTPYFSIAQNFWKTSWGSMNFMNSTGYIFAVDNERTESLFSSFHLDYNVRNANMFFPLVEVNYQHYTRNGGARDFGTGFEGNNFLNLGSLGIAGRNELTVALGARFALSQHIQFGLAGEFNVLGNDNGRHLDDFRLTADMILRY